MTYNPEFFRPVYTDLPAWECPTCGKGHLAPSGKSRTVLETGPSKAIHDQVYWDPEFIERRFVELLICNFASCGEVVAVSGNISVREVVIEDHEGSWTQAYVDHLHVRSLVPAPLPIRPPDKTPDSVKASLATAASLLWQSPESAANHVRQAVEHLMDAKAIKKREKKGGKALTLHARILHFAKQDEKNGDILRAIKWIGNDGSHKGGLSREQVLDAFDMMELALVNLYSNVELDIMKKVRAVIRSKEKKVIPKSSIRLHAVPES